MPKKCSICQDPCRAQIEAVLRQGYSVRFVVMRFPDLTLASLEHHRSHFFGPPDASPPAQPPAPRSGVLQMLGDGAARLLRGILRR